MTGFSFDELWQDLQSFLGGSIAHESAGQPIDLDGDGIPDAIGFDLDLDGKLDLINYDFNHDGVVDAVGKDTIGDGRIDTVYYDFNHDGIVDAVGHDTLGDGIIDTISFVQNGVSIHSDSGFSIEEGWEAGLSRYNRFDMLTAEQIPEVVSPFSPFGLDDSQTSWIRRAIQNEKATPGEVQRNISFGASVTCWGGRKVCLGCAGPLIDAKIGCDTGACTGGKKV